MVCVVLNARQGVLKGGGPTWSAHYAAPRRQYAGVIAREPSVKQDLCSVFTSMYSIHSQSLLFVTCACKLPDRARSVVAPGRGSAAHPRIEEVFW